MGARLYFPKGLWLRRNQSSQFDRTLLSTRLVALHGMLETRREVTSISFYPSFPPLSVTSDWYDAALRLEANNMAHCMAMGQDAVCHEPWLPLDEMMMWLMVTQSIYGDTFNIWRQLSRDSRSLVILQRPAGL